ncbi:MAG: hypothetical protein M1817_005837 [Caeruleum heppii]|nr:MAG: hypothetical protein M1817_005837 [Caeruleum heppii]
MARRRSKKRTHLGAHNGPNKGATDLSAANRTPKSMVLRIGAGEVGPSVTRLVKDVRLMMEPGTASRLKERRSNRLRDYITMAGPLGVSHLLLFSRSPSGNTNLRIALNPRGPTLHFRVERYSLCKDIQKALKHAKGGGKEYSSAPLLVMNNFTSQSSSESHTSPAVPKHLEQLTTSIFQSLFPPISPQTTPLSSIRRVLLLNRELDTNDSDTSDGVYTLNLRHYAITTKATGLSKGIRRLKAAEKVMTSREKKKKAIPNLGRLDDVADYLLDPAATAGFTSASESEVETDAEVEVLETSARQVLNNRQREQIRARGANGTSKGTRRGVEKRAVKLVELGPRMKLRLMKVEEGVCNGKVMWHEFHSKTNEEVKDLDQLWEGRRQEKERRKKEQRANVEKKRKAPRAKAGAEGDAADEVEDEDMDDDWDSEDFEDDDGLIEEGQPESSKSGKSAGRLVPSG